MKERFPQKKKTKKGEEITRRDFLKFGTAAAVIGAGVIALNLHRGPVQQDQNKNKDEGVGSPKPAKEVTKEQAEQAIQKIQQEVLNHPEPLVREKLLDWIKTGKVLFAANNLLPETAVSVEQNKGKDQVLLWYNITFLLEVPNVVTPVDKQAYLWLALYHESVHIDDHFSGRFSLMPLLSDVTVSEEKTAQRIWDMEWSAVSKEWELAKRLKKPELVPVIYEATKNGETPQTFLQGFYQLRMTGNAVALNSKLSAGITSRYHEELAKLK